jgi:hypothetical protein
MSNAVLVNFAAGETSQRSRGRFDLSWFQSSCEKFLNFIPEVSGPARYRPGAKHVRFTRGGAVARMIRFQFNSSQAYMLEFTPGYMRVYKNGDLLTTTRTSVTAITRAATAVITVAATTNLVDGDEIILSGIVGMEELNGRQVKLANKSGSTYQLVDPITGAGVDSTNFGAWISGGTVSGVYEIASPYLEDDLEDISAAPSAINGIMYFANPAYEPYKLSVDSADVFTLAIYTRTNDPFVAGTALNVGTGGQGVNRSGEAFLAGGTVTAGYTVVWFPLGTIIVPNTLYTFAAVVGTTEINAGVYTLETFVYGDAVSNVVTPGATVPWNAVTAVIKTAAGADVNSAAWTAYVSGGTATPAKENPIAVAFYEGRLGFYGTNIRPNSIFLSRAPDDDGNPRYDDFTGGADADHACFFALAPVSGQVDYAAWAQGTEEYLFIGTFGGPFRVSGSGLDEPITPSSINARQFDSFGCEATSAAIAGARVFFIQRGGRALRTVRYNADGRLETYDMLLNAEHIAQSRLRRVIFQAGHPDTLWVIREDGVLAGLTVQGAENVAGWHRQKLGGVEAVVVDAQSFPRTELDDQLWIVARRTVGGVERHSVEILADDVVFPDLADFYLGQGELNRENDLEAWKNAVYRRQEEYIHLDAAGTYNGSDRGAAVDATLTPGALTGDDVAFTASAAVFKASDVGNELWKKPSRETGIGAGRAVITAVNGAGTVATCDIDVDFDTVEAIAAGEWHIAVDTIYAPHLAGQVVAIVTDGAVYSDGNGDVDADFPLVTADAASGAVVLDRCAAVVHVGLPYEGFLKTHNLELGGQGGPVQNKPRTIVEMFIRFLGTLGANYGTDIYALNPIEHRDIGQDANDRPAPVFSGVRKLHNPDTAEAETGKYVYVSQRLPLPCVVQQIDLRFDTTEES